MAEFYYEKYVRNYEIDFYNDGTEEEKEFLKSKGIELSTYYKSGRQWNMRISGMTYQILSLDYYPALKEYLDRRFEQYIRKLKLEKIENETNK